MLTTERTTNDQRPVILLLGAEGENTKQHLTAVQKELTGLKAIFEPYEQKHHTLFRLEYNPDLTQAELKDHLDQLAGKLSILHFAGHSDGAMLQTDDLQVYADRIADIISVWSSPPDLIFLNGCHNEGQVEAFHSVGVPVVIATSQKVNDATAADFACEFYKSLVGSDEVSLQAAFVAAKQKMQLSSSDETFSAHISSEPKDEQETDENDRSPNLATVHKPLEQVALPWLLYAKSPEQENWTLHQLLTQERPVLGDDRQPINPYKGLESFTKEDKNFFFGRETLIDGLAKDITKSPLVTLFGASGSGKSSLINAGVIPRLCERDEWQIISVKPGNDPFPELASALYAEYSTNYESATEIQTEIRRQKGLARFLSEALIANSPQKKVLLLIDQFEELFTQSLPQVVTAFQQQLYDLVEAKIPNLHVVLVMRADFFADAIENANFARLLNRNLDKKIAQMDEAELRAAINSPAANQRVSINPALLQTLISSVKDQSGSLPLLQDILHQLWEHRTNRNLITLNEYNKLGGLKKALEKRADTILNGFSEQQQEVVKKTLLRLIQTDSNENDTRKRAYSTEFIDDPAAQYVLQELVKERLVVAHQTEDDRAYYEISHETLITNWGNLRKWIDSDRANINLRNKLIREAQEWEKENKDPSGLMTGSRLAVVEEWLTDNPKEKPNTLEKLFFETSITSREKKKRRNYSILAGVIVTLSLIAAVAVWQWFQADRARADTENQILETNYNLGKSYAEVALQILIQDEKEKSSYDEKKAFLYALKARSLSQPIGKNPLSGLALERLTNIDINSISPPRLVISTEDGDLPGGSVKSATFGPSGKLLAYISNDYIYLFNINTGAIEWKEFSNTNFISFEETGKYFLIMAAEGAKLLDLSNYSTFKEVKTSDLYEGLSYLEDDKFSLKIKDEEFLFSGRNRFLDILDPSGPEYSYDANYKLEIIDKAKALITAPDNKTISVKSADDYFFDSIHISPNNKTVSIVCSDNKIRVWSLGEKLIFKGVIESRPNHSFRNPVYNKNGSMIIVPFKTRGFSVYDTATLKEVQYYSGSTRQFRDGLSISYAGENYIEFSQSGKYFQYNSSREKEIKIFDHYDELKPHFNDDSNSYPAMNLIVNNPEVGVYKIWNVDSKSYLNEKIHIEGFNGRLPESFNKKLFDDYETFDEKTTLDDLTPINPIDLDDAGNFISIYDSSNELTYVYNIKSGKNIAKFNHKKHIEKIENNQPKFSFSLDDPSSSGLSVKNIIDGMGVLKISRDGSLLMKSFWNKVLFFSVEDKKFLTEVSNKENVKHIYYNHNNNLIFLAGKFSINAHQDSGGEGEEIFNIKSFDKNNLDEKITYLTFNKSRNEILIGAKNKIYTLDIYGKVISVFTEHGADRIKFNNSESKLAVSFEEDIFIYEAENMKLLKTVLNTGRVSFPSNDDLFVSGGRVWDFSSPLYKIFTNFDSKKSSQLFQIFSFLWEVELVNDEFSKISRKDILEKNPGYVVYNSLLKPPRKGETKLEQIIRWVEVN